MTDHLAINNTIWLGQILYLNKILVIFVGIIILAGCSKYSLLHPHWKEVATYDCEEFDHGKRLECVRTSVEGEYPKKE